MSMKVFALFCLFSISLFAQDFSSIKAKTDLYPDVLTAQSLASKIKSDFTIEENQVKALYAWMTQNIRYDLDEFYSPTQKTVSFKYRTLEEKAQKLQRYREATVAQTLQTKKGVCEGYAQTFANICSLLNIENDLVVGYVRTSTRQIGHPIARPNHVWNAVKLNNEWFFIDATWGAGTEINGQWVRQFKSYYYKIPKNNVYKTHYPEDVVWRLRLGKRQEKEAFYKQPLYSFPFLVSGITLVAPEKGQLTAKNGQITIVLNGLKPEQPVYVGFKGLRFAQKPERYTKGSYTYITTTPPLNSKEFFLLLNQQVAVQFLIN